MFSISGFAIYIDNNMLLQDCFFVSVVIRNHPELQQKPVAVCHSDNAKGTAEISSANYPARGYGLFYSDFSISLHLLSCSGL